MFDDPVYSVFVGVAVTIAAVLILWGAYHAGADACLKQQIVACVGKVYP